MKVIFANTGKERPETLEFVNRCDEYFGLNLVWVEAVTTLEMGIGVQAKVVAFDTANRTGQPYEAFIQKFGIPNQNKPDCTRELKEYPIKAYARNVLEWKGYFTAIGLRSDEMRRVNWEKAAKKKLYYPLVKDVPTTKSDINLFWSKMPFDLELKSYEGNCDLCFKKSLRKLMTLVREKPEMADWWREMEQKYSRTRSAGVFSRQGEATNDLQFYRNNMKIDDIILKSRSPFIPAEDESKLIDSYKQLSFMDMVDAFDPDLDTQEGGCAESCEVFTY